jgi:KipI family sensor histidine kinase inhibitor
MLGFLPGFAYMGEVDETIAAPRKMSPRRRVPKAALGIAGKQTGIYSLESPGGWQIIGRTNVELFTPDDESPAYLQPGDSVKFYPADF